MMIYPKLFLIGIFTLQTFVTFSQEQEIVRLLNKELKKEAKLRLEIDGNLADTLVVIQPFAITNNKLSVAIRKKVYGDTTYFTEQQEIALNKITSIIKDINVIFETQSDAVKITNKEGNKVISSRTYDLFFLHLSAEKGNELLASQLINAFTKAGYNIKMGIWAD